MKEETDLRAVKALAHAMLELDIEQTRLSPLVVSTPLPTTGSVEYESRTAVSLLPTC